jgi:hypothetical protein
LSDCGILSDKIITEIADKCPNLKHSDGLTSVNQVG